MKRYIVSIRGERNPRFVDAFGYTTRDDKIFFHKSEDKSDFDEYFLEKAVKSITTAKPPPDFPYSSMSI